MFKESKEQQQQQQQQQQEDLPEFGAGSEFGRKEKEEARRRKYERRKNKQNNSPWILKVGGKHGKKYRGIREGGVTENASYYVFFQASDGMFEAFPVNEWYNFTPFQRYKALSAEEAEEKFIKRDQILNFFQLRNMAKTKGANDKDDSSKKSERKMKKEFKVSDMDDWYDMSENDDDDFSGDGNDDSDDDNKQRKSRKDKGKKDKQRKMKDEDSDEEEPLEDSDEGDYDDKEVDYMSDESSSSESEEEKVDLKGVADESALRDLVVSEEDEEEEENANKNDNQEPNEDVNKSVDGDKSKLEKNNKDNDSSSDSEFDSENSDIEEPKSALLIQPNKNLNKSSTSTTANDSKSTESSAGNKRKFEQNSQSTISSNEDNNSLINKSNGLKFRHKLETTSTNEQHSMVKKMKIKHDNGITEEAVRRYLIRKPMTAADLVQKFKNKTARKAELPDLLAEILRKINPEKQNIKGKMYLSLKPT
ncbi:general transcription factor IIF subunit 1-like protein [Euroglyphus maynei]|uniref:Transcription initiation factor IIF subunit alpha n=1 Tax=Euroglyphus maynei TaxID=6958 RepID=A0A1Y3BAX2_EURMA|nr:general transcription factor IIF subunit 1-like protein [Euroglyphus maynei]